jgi:phosphohistidine phosphatase
MARYGITPEQRHPWDREPDGSSFNVEDQQPMRLYLVQHGPALPAAEHPDRPLTDQGRREVEAVAALLARGQPPVSRIVHSGKTRARQTAEMLADHLTPGQPVEAAAGLDPNDPVEPWIATVNGWTEDGLLVGHQPFLGQLVSRLVLGEERALVDYRPGTVVCLEPTGAGGWRIVGMLGPALL